MRTVEEMFILFVEELLDLIVESLFPDLLVKLPDLWFRFDNKSILYNI